MINPISRQAMLVCINATTGDIIYTLNGGVAPGAAANGYLLGSGIFDGKMYCLGKGPTKTTVTAPLTTVPAGTGVLIQGSVMDMSPVSQDHTSQVGFPNGVPAVADEDMSEWMDYLHMQNATLLNNPPVPKGVTVKLVALGPNHGDVIDIGTVTSDSGGMFKKTWTAPSEGEYTVYATFDGSGSYYGSYAETGMVVAAAPETTGTTGTQPAADNTLMFAGIIIGVIVAIVIGLVNLLVLSKRK
jgi:hypothetical protein